MPKPILFLSATPRKLVPRSVDINSAEIEQLLLHPPNNRQSGWNMDFPRRTIERTGNSVTRGDEDYGTLTVMSSGYMELVVSVAKSFFWPQEDDEIAKTPRFNPYAVCEFPVTFLRLFRLLADTTGLTSPFVVNLAYKGIKGVTLWPGHPMSIAYGSPMTQTRSFPSDELILDSLVLDQDFIADTVAYKLLLEIYGAFGYKAECIPFYNDETGEFTF